MSAVRNGHVYFADGNAYFNRPGPRLADSGEILREILSGRRRLQSLEGIAWVKPLEEPAARP
jgi:iron complex transport system substrate-binding protein